MAMAKNPTIQPLPKRNWNTEFNLTDTFISTNEKEQLFKLLDEFTDVCSSGNYDLGKCGIIRHSIDTGNNKPIKQAIRRIHPKQIPIVKEMTNEMK